MQNLALTLAFRPMNQQLSGIIIYQLIGKLFALHLSCESSIMQIQCNVMQFINNSNFTKFCVLPLLLHFELLLFQLLPIFHWIPIGLFYSIINLFALILFSDFFLYNLQLHHSNMDISQSQIYLKPNICTIKKLSMKARDHSLQHYEIKNVIEQNQNTIIYRAIERHTRKELAVKAVDISGLSQTKKIRVRKEVKLHSMLDHPNIVQVYQSIQTPQFIYIFMQLAKGCELFEYLKENGRISQQIAARIFYKILGAIRYIHKQNIAHRDIKPENIIINQDFQPKLIDFGLSTTFHPQAQILSDTICGSPFYMAPEILNRVQYSSAKADIWSLGVLLFVMLEAKYPFLIDQKKDNCLQLQTLVWNKPIHSSAQAIQIYRSVFRPVDQRATSDELINSCLFWKYGLREEDDAKDSRINKEIRKAVKLSIIKKISKMLNISENQVKLIVLKRTLGKIYCIYNLLLKSKQIQKIENEENERQKQRSQNKRNSLIQSSMHTLQSQSLDKIVRSRYFKTRSKNKQILKLNPVQLKMPLVSPGLKAQRQRSQISSKRTKDLQHLKIQLKERIGNNTTLKKLINNLHNPFEYSKYETKTNKNKIDHLI